MSVISEDAYEGFDDMFNPGMVNILRGRSKKVQNDVKIPDSLTETRKYMIFGEKALPEEDEHDATTKLVLEKAHTKQKNTFVNRHHVTYTGYPSYSWVEMPKSITATRNNIIFDTQGMSESDLEDGVTRQIMAKQETQIKRPYVGPHGGRYTGIFWKDM